LTLEPLTGHREFEGDVLNLLAAVYAAEDRIQEAMAALRRAAEIAPKDERNYLDLAVICMEHQAPNLALEMATVGLKNIPDSARLYATRGAINATMSRTEDAEADFEAAERLMPDALYGSVGLSLLFRQTNQLDRSIAILRERLRHAPDDPTLNFLLADALLRSEAQIDSQELKEARAALLRSVRAKPDFAKAHAELGKIYLKDGETEKAMNELRLALRQDPQDRVALHQLSIALQRQARTEEAREVATKLRNLLRRDQEEEKQRNRFALLKAPPSR
jgi:tetratricopeptide (TPR) repeat protein